MNRSEEILRQLRTLADPAAVAGMARFGISPENNYGVRVPVLRKLAREIGRDHGLARELWVTGVREARIIAGLVAVPRKVTEQEMEDWVRDFHDWEVCDQTCMNLFQNTAYAYVKAVEWGMRPEEFVKRAGFILMARLAVADEQAGDADFRMFLRLIEREAGDSRNYVKKAVNWALRQIGKRSRELNAAAVDTAHRIQTQNSKSARWIAAAALRELTGDAVQERLRTRAARRCKLK